MDYILKNAGQHRIKDLIERDDWNVAGIADAHGIESYCTRDSIDSRKIYHWLIRAEANRHRHAVVYFALLNQEAQDKMNAALDNKDDITALKVIKKNSDNVLMTNQNSWQLIPNKELDPYANA
jgi:hypothetical protein